MGPCYADDCVWGIGCFQSRRKTPVLPKHYCAQWGASRKGGQGGYEHLKGGDAGDTCTPPLAPEPFWASGLLGAEFDKLVPSHYLLMPAGLAYTLIESLRTRSDLCRVFITLVVRFSVCRRMTATASPSECVCAWSCVVGPHSVPFPSPGGNSFRGEIE